MPLLGLVAVMHCWRGEFQIPECYKCYCSSVIIDDSRFEKIIYLNLGLYLLKELEGFFYS